MDENRARVISMMLCAATDDRENPTVMCGEIAPYMIGGMSLCEKRAARLAWKAYGKLF